MGSLQTGKFCSDRQVRHYLCHIVITGMGGAQRFFEQAALLIAAEK